MPREVFATSTKLDDSVSSRTPAEYETLGVDGESSRLASETVSASARIVIFDAFTNNVHYKRATNISERPAFYATRYLHSQQLISSTTQDAIHVKGSPDYLGLRGSSK